MRAMRLVLWAMALWAPVACLSSKGAKAGEPQGPADAPRAAAPPPGGRASGHDGIAEDPRGVARMPASGRRPPPTRLVDAPEIVVQRGHTHNMTQLAADPLGRFLVTSSQDTTVKLWEARSGRELRTLVGHGHAVQAVLVSADGSAVFSTGDDKKVIRHLAMDGEAVWSVRLTGVPHGVEVDGRHLASAGRGTLYVATSDSSLFELAEDTGAILRRIRGPAHANALAVSPSGDRLAIAAKEGRVYVLSAADLAVSAEGHAHAGKRVLRAAFVDDVRLLTSGEDGSVVLWDARKGKVLRTFEVSGRAVHALSVGPKRQRFVVADWRGDIGVWDLATGQRIARHDRPAFSGPEYSGIHSVAWSPDGQRIDYATANLMAQWSWAPNGRSEVRSRQRYGGTMAALDPSSGGLLVLSQGSLRALDLQTGRVDNELRFDAPVGDLLYVPETNRLVLSMPERVALLDIKPEAIPQIIPTTGFATSRLALSPDRRRLAVGGWQEVLIASVSNVEQRVRVSHGGFGVNGLDFDASGRRLIYCPVELSGKEGIVLLDAASGEVVRRFTSSFLEEDDAVAPFFDRQRPFFHCAFLDGGRRVVGASTEPLHIFEVETGARVGRLEGPGPGLSATSLLPLEGQRLLAGFQNGDIWLFDTKGMRALRTFAGHRGPVRQLLRDVQPDGFMSVGDDATLRLWQLDETSSELILVPVTRGEESPGASASTIVFDGAGFFDFTAFEGLEQVHMARGLSTMMLNQLVDVFYQPGLLGRVRSGRASPRRIVAGERFRMPPRVDLRAELKDGEVQADIGVDVEDGGLSHVALFINGRRAADQATDAEPRQRVSVRLSAKAQPGENRVLAVAYAHNGLKAYSAEVRLESDEVNQTARTLHLLVVGVDDYAGEDAENRLGDLQYPVADAVAVADALPRVAPKAYVEHQTIRLLRQEATRARILEVLDRWARTVDDNDAVIVFLAGHGLAQPYRSGFIEARRFYFVPADYRSIEALARTGLSSDDLTTALSRLRAPLVTLLLDTCHSGASAEAFSSDVSGTLRVFGGTSGISVLASATALAPAFEDRSLGHGVFTAALLAELACPTPGPRTFAALARGVEARMAPRRGQSLNPTTVAFGDASDAPMIECPELP